MEVWKPVEGFEGEYSISTHGRVRNDRSGHLSYGHNTGIGYMRVDFWRTNKVIKTEYVHRLVAKAFLEKGPDHTEVNHIDGNRRNNHISNLEWVTSSGNTEHAVATGALAPWNHPRKPIIATNLDTGEELYFKSISKAELHFKSRHICMVLKGRRRQVKGYTFRYANGGDADVAGA